MLKNFRISFLIQVLSVFSLFAVLWLGNFTPEVIIVTSILLLISGALWHKNTED